MLNINFSLRPRRRSSTQSLRSLLSRHDSESEMVIGGELDMVRPAIKRDMEQEDIAKLIESETSETGTVRILKNNSQHCVAACNTKCVNIYFR